MLHFVIATILAEIWILIICFLCYFRFATNKLLKENQKKWDRLKMSNSWSETEETEAYIEFIKHLPSHPVVGKCFPRQ